MGNDGYAHMNKGPLLHVFHDYAGNMTTVITLSALLLDNDKFVLFYSAHPLPAYSPHHHRQLKADIWLDLVQ